MSTKNKKSNEDVDVGQLFKVIGNIFNKFFLFVEGIFNNLFLAFVWLVFFIRKRAVIFLITALAGLGIGFLFDKTSPPTYKSTISVKQNYETGENLYGSIIYYNGLLQDGDYKVLGEVLGIEEKSTKEIVGFSIEPVITDNDRVILFDRYITDLDSLAISKIEYEDFVQNIEDYKHKFQQISIKSKTRVNFNSVFNNIVKNIATNDFFLNEQAKDISELQQSKAALDKALIKSDSLQRTYKRVLENRLDSNAAADIGISFDGNNDSDKTYEFDLYKSDIEIRKEIVKIERELKDKQNIIDLISSKQDSGFVDNTKDLLGVSFSIKTYYMFALILATFGLLLAMEFLNYLERYRPKS